MGKHGWNDTKSGSNQTGQTPLPECEYHNADPHIRDIKGQENVTERKKHTRYKCGRNRLHFFPTCQPAIDVSSEENLFIQISGKGNKKDKRQEMEGHGASPILYGNTKDVNEGQREGSDDSSGNPNQNSKKLVPFKPFHQCCEFWRNGLHEKHKAYAAEAKNQKCNRIIDEAYPQKSFISDTPETQRGSSRLW